MSLRKVVCGNGFETLGLGKAIVFRDDGTTDHGKWPSSASLQ